MRLLRRLALAFLLIPFAALAQGVGPGGGGTVGPGGGGCTTNCNFTGTTTTAALSASGGINTTAATGYSQNGISILSQINTVNGSLQIGALAGCNAGLLNACGGYGSGASVTSANELAAWGNLSANSLTTGIFDTALGQHSLGYEIAGNADTACGNDSMRNVVGVSNTTACGKNASRDDFGSTNAAFGAFSLIGNAASIAFGGTKTTGDIITTVYTSAFLAGSPVTVNYTVTAGDTLATIPANYCIAFAAANLNDNYGCNTDSVRAPFVVQISHNGTSTVGNIVTVTGSSNGTETLTIGGGASGANNSVFGAYGMFGYAMTTAHDNTGGGQGVLGQITTAIGENCYGSGSCGSATTNTHENAVGQGALANAVGTFANNVFGNNCGSTITAGNSNGVFGDCTTGGSGITTGTGNFTIGNNRLVQSATGNSQLDIMGAIFGVGNNTTGSAISGGRIGFYVIPGSGTAVDVGVAPLRSQAGLIVGNFAPALTNGEVAFSRITASATAPGAGGGKIELVCGTTAGTAKLVAFGGTSTTPATILDNIGTGLSGC